MHASTASSGVEPPSMRTYNWRGTQLLFMIFLPPHPSSSLIRGSPTQQSPRKSVVPAGVIVLLLLLLLVLLLVLLL